MKELEAHLERRSGVAWRMAANSYWPRMEREARLHELRRMRRVKSREELIERKRELIEYKRRCYSPTWYRAIRGRINEIVLALNALDREEGRCG